MLLDCAADFVSYLDLFDIRVPLSHLLHFSHQLFIKGVRMLLQHHFQLEHLPNVRHCLAQDFVSIGLWNIVRQELKVFIYFQANAVVVSYMDDN